MYSMISFSPNINPINPHYLLATLHDFYMTHLPLNSFLTND